MRSYALQLLRLVEQGSKQLGLFIVFGLWEYWLGKTKRLVANSTVELLTRLFTKGDKSMKQLLNVGNGAIVISEDGGDFTLEVSETAALGGGQAAGIVAVQGSGKVVLKGRVAFDLGVALIKAHAPAALQPVIDEAGKLADVAIDKA